MQDVSNGQERVRTWPRRRKPSLLPKTRDNMDKFAQAQMATKFMAPEILGNATVATQGTPLLPRDILTMMLYNRMMAFQFSDGKWRHPLPFRTDVSESLDALGNQVGMTLVRGPEFWEAVLLPNEQAQASATISGAFWTANVGWQLVPLNAVVQDPLGWWDATANGLRPNIPGTYRIDARVRTNTTGMSALGLYKNGVLFKAIGPDPGHASLALAGGIDLAFDGVNDVIAVAIFSTQVDQYTPGEFDTYLSLTGPQ